MSQATGKQHCKRRPRADALGVAEKSTGSNAKGAAGGLGKSSGRGGHSQRRGFQGEWELRRYSQPFERKENEKTLGGQSYWHEELSHPVLCWRLTSREGMSKGLNQPSGLGRLRLHRLLNTELCYRCLVPREVPGAARCSGCRGL